MVANVWLLCAMKYDETMMRPTATTVDIAPRRNRRRLLRVSAAVTMRGMLASTGTRENERRSSRSWNDVSSFSATKMPPIVAANARAKLKSINRPRSGALWGWGGGGATRRADGGDRGR